MKKRWLAPVVAVAVACVFAAGCGMPKKNTVEQGGKKVFPVSSYDETLPIYMGDVMPYYDDGVMNVYHLQGTYGTYDDFFHPISRLTTTDFVNYTDLGISINFEDGKNDSPDMRLGTGSFIKDNDGKYHCFYTGENPNKPLGQVQVIRHAVSTDNQQSWTKIEEFAIVCAGKDDFRDPYVYYDGEEEVYNMLVVTRDDSDGTDCGVIKKYTSASLDAPASGWKDEGIFFKNDDGTYNMECPSYIEYNGIYYLAYSEQGENRVTHYRYRTESDGEWLKFERDSIDATGFYAGRLEKAGDKLYAFAWCAVLTGGSVGDFDWSGNLVVHEIKQLSSGELCAVMVSGVKDAFSTQVKYKFIDGEQIENASFDCEDYKSYCAEKLGRQVTRISFSFVPENYGGNFGITFGLDGKYNDRIGSHAVVFDMKRSNLACYNDISNIIRYGSALASLPFGYDLGREYVVDMIIDGEVLTVYLDETICLTARFTDMQRRNFAFFSNGNKVSFKGITFYE